jgi:long-chain fatty acid transport protein
MMPLTPGSLGTSAGPGFGWEDVTVVKLGAEWKRSNSLTWRFGYSQCNQPIPNTEHMFNILAPSTVEKHVSVGFTKKLKNKREFNFAITRALENEITGINPLDPAQKISLKMGQWEAAFGYTWKY